jgi:phage terminase large subunit
VPSNDPEKYANLKAELYWGLRERLEDGDMGGLDDDQIAQLSTIRYDHNARGQIIIESKDDMVARGVPSPDEAEAVMLSYSNGGLDVWERL